MQCNVMTCNAMTWNTITYNSIQYNAINYHLQATVVGCNVGGAWVNSLSYADDMVLLAPTVTALQTLLEVCHTYAGPHDIVHNTTKAVCTLVQPKQSQGWYSTTAKCCYKYAVRKSHLHLLRPKSNCSSHIVTLFMDVLFGVIHTGTLLENLLSDLVTYSSVLQHPQIHQLKSGIWDELN